MQAVTEIRNLKYHNYLSNFLLSQQFKICRAHEFCFIQTIHFAATGTLLSARAAAPLAPPHLLPSPSPTRLNVYYKKYVSTVVQLGIPRRRRNTNIIQAGRSGDLEPLMIYYEVQYSLCEFLKVHLLISSHAIECHDPIHKGMSRSCKT